MNYRLAQNANANHSIRRQLFETMPNEIPVANQIEGLQQMQVEAQDSPVFLVPASPMRLRDTQSPVKSTNSPNKSPKSPRKTPSSPSKKVVGIRLELFGAPESLEPAKKRLKTEGTSFGVVDIQQRKIEFPNAIIEPQYLLALPPEILFHILSFCPSRDCVSLSLIQQFLFKHVHENVFTSIYWGEKLASEYQDYALKGEFHKANHTINLLDRSCARLDPLSEYPSGIAVRFDVNELLKNTADSFGDSYEENERFIFNILTKARGIGMPSIQASREYLINLHKLCVCPLTANKGYIPFQARKIIAFYINNEDKLSLLKKAINILFTAIENAMLSGDKENVNEWINFLEPITSSVDPNLWLDRCFQSLKRVGNTPLETANLEEPKNKILVLINNNLPTYLSKGMIFIFRLLLEGLRHRALHQSSKKIIWYILCRVIYEQKNIILVHGLVKTIVQDRERVALNKDLPLLISAAIGQHGQKVIDELLILINNKLNVCNGLYKDGFRSTIRHVYECSSDEVRWTIENAIMAFIYNRSNIIEDEFYNELPSLLKR